MCLLVDRDPTFPRDYYRSREKLAQADAAQLETALVRLGRMRMTAFALALLPLLFVEGAPNGMRPTLVGLVVAMAVLFAMLVRRFRRTEHLARDARLRGTIARESLARLDRRWSDLPLPPLVDSPPDHPSADDLDLVGHASLCHLIGRVTTVAGRSVLRRVLLDPYAVASEGGADLLVKASAGQPCRVPRPDWDSEIRERQNAVRLLAPERALREEIELAARRALSGGRDGDTHVFLEWLALPRWLDRRRHLLYAARALAVLTPASLVTWLFWVTPGAIPILSGLVAYAIQWVVGREAAARFTAAEAGEGDLEAWRAHLEIAARLPTGSKLLDRLRETARNPSPGAAQAIEELGRITHTAGARYSSLAHFPLVVLFAWDVHMLERLERWHARHHEAVARWVQATGELEVLAALGGLLHDHPDWSFPDVVDEPAGALHARALGHPLVEPARCVRNDVEIPPPGRLLLVTGSNMAGKTTLLRAIGVNQILALAGGPVAAEQLKTRPLLPWCTMRVRDSLDLGVSYFLAELRRLKLVVDAAEAGPVLYLLDEMLQGTNSAERRTATQIVLARLVESGAIGAVTTHDLGLGEIPELRDRAVKVHFSEHVTKRDDTRALEFDYVLRPGLATSRNALLLLELAGLGPRRPAP